MKNIQTVTVVGATGTMGPNVAGIFASFGDAKVFCVGRNLEKVNKTIPRIVKSVRADSIEANLIPADFSMLADCVSKSDLVFESLVENMDIKTRIANEIAKSLRKDAISCTGSSGLSITKLAECYPEELRKHFFGVHMFNPPYNMPLCELTPTCYSDKFVQTELKEYLEKRLIRTVVEVKDSPAFLANRIGFQFINEAMQYAEKYKDNGGIDYVDAILGPFTGRSMAPLITSDFVGLDIHKAIVDNLYKNTCDYANSTYVLPEFAERLIENNKLGRKTGGGLYQRLKYDNGLKRQTVYDINTGMYRDIIPYVFPFAEKMKRFFREGDYKDAFAELINNHSLEAEICLTFLLNYIVYSIYCEKEVGYSSESADKVMAAGFHWCPPKALYGALSESTCVPDLIRERLPQLYEKVDVDSLLADIKPSGYDFRPFFKTGI